LAYLCRYEFAYDVGGLDPSRYFGFPKDLYHLDHFMGYFYTKLAELVNARSYKIEDSNLVHDSEAAGGEVWVITVVVLPAVGDEERRFAFHVRRKAVGARKGTLMTEMILRS
jgi:hypothetical protein